MKDDGGDQDDESADRAAYPPAESRDVILRTDHAYQEILVARMTLLSQLKHAVHVHDTHLLTDRTLHQVRMLTGE